MSKFVSNLVIGIVSLFMMAVGFILGWQTKAAIQKQEADDEAKGITRYHRVKFGTPNKEV